MKDQLLTTLRNRQTPTKPFREASQKLAKLLVDDVKEKFEGDESIIMICILRSSLVFLPAMTEAFPNSPVAVVGIKRDEETALPHCYYENVPPITEDSTIIIPDPMLATGGTATDMVNRLLKKGANPKNIHFISLIAAPEGVAKLSELIPKENITVVAVDEGLDAKKFIVPGLGDFGDRYFGYAP